jgi:hypothetical protein
MAKIVLGIGTSHSPLLVMAGTQWELRAQDDRRNKSLSLLDGRVVSYDQLQKERGEPYTAESDPARFPILAAQAEAALDRLAQALSDAQPDVLLVVGDDQGELFGSDNQPAISVFHGTDMVMKSFDHLSHMPAWADRAFWAGYRMDLPFSHPAAASLGLDLVHGLIRQGVDVASSDKIADPTVRGFGHAFGFVVARLMKDVRVPILPVMLNTYFPPNAPTASRCHEIGQKIHAALAASPSKARVAVIASGGLSHFLCEEAFDRRLIDAFKRHDVETLTQVPQEAIQSGSSEIRNWIVLSGAVKHLDADYVEYIPVYRTPVGTGIGLGFMTWR